VLNKTENPRQFTLDVAGADGAKIDGKKHFSVEPGAVYETVLRVNIPRKSLGSDSSINIDFIVTPQDNPADAHHQNSKFLAPNK